MTIAKVDLGVAHQLVEGWSSAKQFEKHAGGCARVHAGGCARVHARYNLPADPPC
ncbi:MAG: hypothetical protein MK165_21450 [Pirellulaceae bacterium]|nr:hypothetical protein [Pirellulaceae bacterium]